MIATAAESGDDRAAVYVLLRTAGELATVSRELELAWQAWELLGQQFDVDTIQLCSDSLMKVTPSATEPAQQTALLTKHEELLEKCITAEKFELVDGIAANAEKIAAVGDHAQAMWAWKRHREDAAVLLAAFAAASRAKSSLAETPDDAKANAELGRYLCFVRADWEKGLGHLAKGDDEALRSLADRELKSSEDKKAGIALGDGWREISEKLTGRMRSNCLKRAKDRYVIAELNLSGLDKALAQKRLAELPADELTTLSTNKTSQAETTREAFAAKFTDQAYVEIRNSVNLLDLNKDFTIELWVRWPLDSASAYFAGDEAWPQLKPQEIIVPAPCGWVLRYRAFDGEMTLDFSVGVKERGDWLSITTPVKVSDQWRHVAVSRARDNLTVYLDGRPIGEANVRGMTLVASPTPLYLGCRKDSFRDRRYFGEIAKFRLSSAARYQRGFQPEMEWKKDDRTLVLYNFDRPARDGLIEDASENNHDGILSSGVSVLPTKVSTTSTTAEVTLALERRAVCGSVPGTGLYRSAEFRRNAEPEPGLYD